MIKEKTIWGLLSDPDKPVNDDELHVLAQLLDKYPYFQPLHFLKAYKVFKTSRRKSRQYISKLAAYTTDREIIYEQFSAPPSRAPYITGISVAEKASTSERPVSTKTVIEKSPVVVEEVEKPEKVREEAFKGNFFEWLDHISKEGTQQSVQKEESVNKEAGNFSVDKKELNTSGKNALIDRFIKEQPKISRLKREIFSAENMARKSIREDEELVSETLARINWRQGNFNKAIKMYERLGLLYPDKIRYFAEQIERVKEQKNNK